MKQIASYILLAAALLLCTGQLHAQAQNSGTVTADGVSVEWKPLIELRMQLHLDSLHVAPDQSVEIIPLLQGAADTLQLPRVLVNGRVRHLIYKRERETTRRDYHAVVRRQNGTPQSVDYVLQLPSEPWMDGAQLSFVTDLCGCGWQILARQQAETPVAWLESPKYRPSLTYIAPVREEVKAREKSGRAFLDFPVNQTAIYPDYHNNPQELCKIQATIDSVHTDKYATITEVTIKGYASPEGSYANNTRLAKGRAATLLEHVKGLYHFEGVTFSVDSEPEDWEGLERMVAACGLPEREELLAIIRDTTIRNLDARKLKLKRLKGGEPYRYLLQNFYPALRHSDYTVKYVIRNFTVAETKEVLYTDPKQLSLEEMYRVAQTDEVGSDAFNEVFEIAVRMYPDDPVSNLNAANAALMRRDPQAARRYLLKAQPGPEKEAAEKGLRELEEFLKNDYLKNDYNE